MNSAFLKDTFKERQNGAHLLRAEEIKSWSLCSVRENLTELKQNNGYRDDPRSVVKKVKLAIIVMV